MVPFTCIVLLAILAARTSGHILPDRGELQSSCLQTTCFNVKWTRDCGAARYINQLTGIYKDTYRDRAWTICCANLTVQHSKKDVRCDDWTSDMNAFHGVVNFTCPDDGYLSGIESYHSYCKQDRRWKFHCCYAKKLRMTNCTYTEWVNSLNDDVRFKTNASMALKVMESTYSSSRGDRVYKFQQCQLVQKPGPRIEMDQHVSNSSDAIDAEDEQLRYNSDDTQQQDWQNQFQ